MNWIRNHLASLRQLALVLLSGDVALNPGPLKFGFANCRSIRNKGPILCDEIQTGNFDVFGLTETHIKALDTPSFLNELTPEDFSLVHTNRENKRGGGVGFFIKSALDFKTIHSPEFSSFENHTVCLTLDGRRLFLGVIYRPPASSVVKFFEDFLSYVGFLSSLSPSFVICGDFNLHVDIMSPTVSEFKSVMDSCCLSQYIDFPTHLHGHTLDLLMAPSEFSAISDVKGSGFISDHKIISCVVDFPSLDTPIQKVVTFRQYHKLNIDKFRSDLLTIPFVSSPSDDIDLLHEQYMSGLSSLLDIHAPVKTKQLIKPAPSWITDEYRTAKCMRRQFERAWRRDKSPENRSRLRRQINRCNHILNRNKGCFYRDLVSENCGDSKRLWHALNRTLSRSNSTVLPSFDDEKSLANRFGSFFIDKIKKIRDTFKYTRSQVLHPDNEPPTFCSFQAVTETEVLKFIKESPSKTCSLDPCPTHIVKQCIDILLPSLTKLVNLSLKNGIFLNPFKQAIVTPLLKKSTLSKEDLKSYRPVSGLSFLSKLVERIVAAQIRSHMDSHDLGNTFQSAYKVGHSTETALLCIKNEIHLSLSKGMPTALVLLDLSAAFDTIDHDTLLSCLSSRFGFAGSALKWFRSYLQDRFQSVKIGSSLSNLFKLKFGVPQGSVLGPLLFSLYTTPLSQVIRKYTGVRYHFYADDTQLFIHLSPDDSLKSFDRLKSCLNDIQVWMSENKLKLNPDKTEFIVFGAKDRHKWLSDSLPVNILGNCLSPADVVHNLGVLFDAKVLFHQSRKFCYQILLYQPQGPSSYQEVSFCGYISGDCKCSGQ